MKFLDDKAVERLRRTEDAPDTSGTGYRVVERLASGGMGVVYKAADEKLERFVAMKVLESRSVSEEWRTRLAREAKILARLEHPGIVPVHDVGSLADGRMFYTMKLVAGEQLGEVTKTLTSLPDRLRVFLRICDAVAFAHARGVLHRDLKPENVMVGSFGEVLVMDWGLAKVLPDEGLEPADKTSGPARESPSLAAEGATFTDHGTVMGTPGYMSPEQSKGEIGRLDARSDIYSLGAILRFLVEPQSPNALEAVIAKAMATAPADRYPQVGELAAEVSRFLDGAAVRAYREPLLERIGRFYRRHEVAILLILAYLVMRLLFLLFPRHAA